MKTLMKCGCVAQGTNALGRPVCVVHIGIHSGADQVDEAPPPLIGRNARCPYCKTEKPSSTDLAFFSLAPNKPFDDFYCGCRGWD